MEKEYEHKFKECLGECPYCGSNNLDYGTSEILDDTLRYPATCLDCGESFDEDYAIEYAETTYLVEK